MKSFIYVKIRFIGVLFLLILFNSITVFAAGNEEYFRSVFDPDYYYNQYPDLQGQLGNDSEALFHHFMTIGVREGRSGNAEFNLRAYVLHNRDLLDYYKTDLSAYCKHYMEIGKAEGRTCLPTGDEQGLIGTYSTHYDTTAPRAVNIGIAVERLNGTVIQPGQLFSYSQTLLPRIPENGYVMAPAIGRYEYGGGICQVSTTLYNAVLRAELNVTERSPHSMTVHYVDLSEDAAIAGTYKDFKFVNSTEYPIYIEGYTTSDKKITFNIYGKETRDKNRTISFESQMVSETPATTILQEDAGQGIGYKAVSSKGSSGYVAELYKIVKVNGVETDRIKVNKSTYKGTNRVVTYGTAGDPTLSENLRAAIAAQDEALADANIAAAVPAQ